MNEVQKAIQVTKAATQLMKEIQKVPLSPPVPKPGISQTPIKQAQPGFKAPEKGVVKGLFTHHGKEIKEHRKKYGDEFNTDEDYHDYGHARREVNRNWNDKESHSDAAAGLKEMTKAKKNIPDVPMRQAKPPDKKAEWAKKPSAGAWMDKAEKSKEEEEEHEKKESKKEEEEEVDKGSQKMPGDKREPAVKPTEGKGYSTRTEDKKEVKKGDEIEESKEWMDKAYSRPGRSAKMWQDARSRPKATTKEAIVDRVEHQVNIAGKHPAVKKAISELNKSLELISNLNKAYSSTRQGQEKWTKMRPQLAPGSKRDKIAEIVGNKTK